MKKLDWTEIINFGVTFAVVLVLALVMVGLILVLGDRFGGAT